MMLRLPLLLLRYCGVLHLKFEWKHILNTQYYFVFLVVVVILVRFRF